jgi:zinc protease
MGLATQTALHPTRTVLGNGVVFVGKRTRTTPAVSIHMAVHAGSVCDPGDTPGAMWLLSRVIDRGTLAHTADDIADALDSRGISLSVTMSRQLLSLVCTCLAEDFDAVFSLLGEMLTSPTFPDAEIATRKGQVITTIRQDQDNPYVRAGDAMMALLYPSPHPYARPIKGTLEGVERVTREQLVDLHRRTIAPSRLRVVVVGDVDIPHAQELAGRVFEGWSVPPPAPIELQSPPASLSRNRVVLPMMNKSQADIAYGFTSIRRADADYYALQLANHVFGQYAMGGRLGDSIRERQGMAYYVTSGFEAETIKGPLAIRAGVAPENVDRAVASIDEEVTRLVRDGISQSELDDSRRYLIGALPRSLETNAAIASFLLHADVFDLGLDYDVRRADFLRAVTLDRANDAARRVFDADRASVAIAGPYADA